ncbi:heparinase II/III family protein [Microbacterium sp. RU33B]|uniref:heparinase II/III domain-containing protein n=1 Tax=Microbacterium sp. RU33B TaxID=1907390 RepID=UPI0009632952|nr:heparinase II/III family protein [Microbacterium sp. RU33B]SIT68459.1 Heparinase II/III-like protein [Microbacterium sp. RU33B]
MTTAFHGALSDAFAARASAALLTTRLRPADDALPVAPASDREAWGDVPADGILARAGDDLGAPWPIPLAGAAARVHRDGDRDGWEQVAYARQHRVSRAAVAAAVTLDERWTDEVVDGVQLLCEQSSWCWPAHDDTFERHGAVLATVTDPFLDLGAGEVVGQLAWIDHVLGAQLDARAPGIRARIRHEARVRVFDPFVARRDWHWIGLDGDVHNWNPWIHGNVIVAALRLLDQPGDGDRRAAIVALALEGLDRYVTSLPADGAIDEGYSYWWNGACRALEALDVIAHATDGELDAVPAVPALRETVAFPHRSHLGGAWYLNLADGQARPTSDQPWHALHRAARRAGDMDAAAHAAAHRALVPHEAAGFGRLVRALTDRDWIAASVASSPLPRDVWLPSTEVLLVREHAGSAVGLALAVKGGHNGEHHNHNDVGSFVVACDGVPVLVDAGRPTYTKATFGPDRYDIWTMQSSWHNVPEVRGTAQGAGAQFAARDVVPMLTETASALSLDVSGAYPVSALATWRRTATLDRAHEVVRIDDAWELGEVSGEEPETTVRMLVAGALELAADHARITPLDGATPIIVRWPADVTARVVERGLDDPMLSDVWGARLARIDLSVTTTRALSITVEKDTSTLARRATTKDQR